MSDGTEQIVLEYGDFSRGEYGDLGPRVPVDEGWWSGSNMMRFRDGSIGPRPGLRKLTNVDIPDGTVRWMHPTASDRTLAVIGNKACRLLIDRDAGTITLETDFGGAAVPDGDYPVQGQSRTGNEWILVPGQGLYRFNSVGDDRDVISTDIKGRAMHFFRDRLLVANGSRVWYSQPGPTGWETLDNYFDITSYNPVTGFFELRNGIVVAAGGDGKHLDMVTGTIGTSSSVLRRLSSHGAPEHPDHAASIDGEALLLVSAQRAFPELYNGAAWEELTHLAYLGADGATIEAETSTHKAVQLSRAGSWLLTTGLVDETEAHHRALLNWDGCRTINAWGQILYPVARSYPDGVVVLAGHNPADATEPWFFLFDPSLDRPGYDDDLTADVTDTGTGTLEARVTLPAWEAPDGKEAAVRSVIVDFEKHTVGGSEPRRMQARVANRRPYGSKADDADEQTRDWQEDQGVDTVGQARHGFGFELHWGREVQVSIEEVHSVTLRSLSVVVMVRDARVP